MNIHEYQAKQLLKDSGMPMPDFRSVSNSDEAISAIEELGGKEWVIKAQVHAGGRGKAGGVKLVKTKDEALQFCEDILGKKLVTKQSAPDGQMVNTLLIQVAESISKEFYLGMLVDRGRRRISIICSAEGGMDIETVAKERPAAITKIITDPLTGVMNHHIRTIASTLNLKAKHHEQLYDIISKCYSVFTQQDLSLLEINPLCLCEADKLIVLDAKISLDDNALFRHPQLHALYDPTQEDPKEHTAKQFDLNYIALNGNIACMVNGAGLAMATMDIIKLHGGSPANFLDVGGNTNKEKVAEAFKLILSDPNVEAILVNIFGGIVRCDVIAEGILNAVETVEVHVPIIVRLEGTNVEQGKALLANSSMDIITADDLDEAAIKSINAAKNKKS